MSVPNQTPYIIYNANGLTTVFPFEFYIINAGDIQISINGTVVTSGYSVTGVGNIKGGDVTFLTPPASGSVVMLERMVPTYRLTDYQDNGDLLADTVNKDFDRLWMAIQRSFIYLGLALRRPLLGGPYNAEGYRIAELADPIGQKDAVTKNYVDNVSMVRALRVPESYVPILPPAVQRANKLLAFDNAGNPILILPASGSASEVMVELASTETGKGDSFIGTRQPVTGAKDKTVHDWLAEHISIKDMNGVVGDGVNDDAPGINAALTNLASSNKPVVFVPGVYVVNSSITFNVPVVFSYGAVLKPRNGAVIRFNQQIEAGEYTIFDTTDDFVSNYLAVPSIKIALGYVRPEWFGAKTVSSYAELATSIDCSTAFHKAWHATCGEFNVELTPGSFYQSEFYHSYILLAAGKYRIDSHLKFWYRVVSPSVIRYNKNGGGIVGAGMGLSLIVLTNPNDESNGALEFSDMSGEVHMFRDFKVTFYDFNATGEARWFGRTGAGILFSSSDSIYTLNLWSAGFKYLKLDGDGVRRGGVGIQFESLVDHFYGNILTEHCVHGIAFSSCVSNGYNVKGFANTVADISCGNFIPAWPDLIDQAGINLVALAGLESKACPATPIYFGTADNRVSITNVNVKGNAESSSAIVTYRVIDFNPAGGGASGLIQGNVMNVNYGLIDDRTTGFAGRSGMPLRLVFNVQNVAGQSGKETGVAVFRNPLSNPIIDLSVNGALFTALLSACNYASAKLNLTGITGSPQTPYVAFGCTAGKLVIDYLKTSGSNATYLGYAGGSAQVILPSTASTDITAIRKGVGSTADIRQVSSAVYSNIV
ncbi:TPA: phage tail fiber protein [Enterobacter kobei]|uniref:phage tail fiber domain-containing protein n=1 Tax=Enterobacter kobei TaxID=208224 RepID=UPI00388EEC18